MRTITFETHKITGPGGQEIDFDYKRELTTVAGAPMPGSQGFTVADMRQALAVTAKLAEANGVVELNEDEWQFLKPRVEAQRWAVADQIIVDFVAAVTGATKTDREG